LRRQRATCGRSRLTALRWPGDLWSKSADGAAMALRLVVEVGWRRCDDRAICGRSRLMALRWPGDLWSKSADGVAAWRLLGVLLCTEVRSIRRAVQWSPMKPEGWSGRFPLKSPPTCSYRWWLRLTERAARIRELHCWKCTC
jgi:hypothetical protein